jgi:ureidoglycolate lyase
MRLTAQPLTAGAFAPFGDVLDAPAQPGRTYFDESLANGRAGARPSLSIVHSLPATALPLRVAQLERHEFSSQSFVPLHGGRWLVIVCPSDADGGPDVAAARAFVARPGQGVTYRGNTWHHSLTVLDQAASHAIFMWRDGTHADEEFRRIAPFSVDLPTP